MLSKNILRKIAIIFLSISLNMCFECSNEPSHRDGSFEYSQHMFWLRNKKINFQLHTLIWGPVLYSGNLYIEYLTCIESFHYTPRKLCL